MPAALKITLQVVAGRVIVQFVFAPVIEIVPVGAVDPPVTVTVTATDWFGVDGSGVWVVMVVVVGCKFTVCVAVPLLLLWVPSPE